MKWSDWKTCPDRLRQALRTFFADLLRLDLAHRIELALGIVGATFLAVQTRVVWRQTSLLETQTSLLSAQTQIQARQTEIAKQQTLLQRRQTEFLDEERQSARQSAQTEQTAHWNRLRTDLRKMMDYFPPEGIPALHKKQPADRFQLFQRLKVRLEGGENNPVLIAHKDSLARWRNALATAEFGMRFVEAGKPEEIQVNYASRIFKDIGEIWVKLILRSNEVSPTGGLPANLRHRRKVPKD